MVRLLCLKWPSGWAQDYSLLDRPLLTVNFGSDSALSAIALKYLNDWNTHKVSFSNHEQRKYSLLKFCNSQRFAPGHNSVLTLLELRFALFYILDMAKHHRNPKSLRQPISLQLGILRNNYVHTLLFEHFQWTNPYIKNKSILQKISPSFYWGMPGNTNRVHPMSNKKK